MTNQTITNPTADQLEAGGTVSGTARYGLFTYEVRTLWAGRSGNLYIGTDPHIYTVAWRRTSGERCYNPGVTVTFYTPPKPAPSWWEACDDDAMVTYTPDCVDELGPHVVTAKRYRTFDRPDADFRNPRRVHVSDYDSTVPVPRDALDKLHKEFDAVGGWRGVGVAGAVYDLLRAVDETGGEK